MVKKIAIVSLAVLCLAACTKQETELHHPEFKTLSLSVETIQSDTKVQLNEEAKTVWNAGDKVSVFYKNDVNDCWEFDGKTGDRNGSFTRESDDDIADPLFDNIYVVYPYTATTTLDIAKKGIAIDFPSVQHYTKGSYGVGSNIMFAKSKTDKFKLKNLSSYVAFQIKGEKRIKSIKFSGNDNEIISGTAYISLENELMDHVEDMHNTDDVETRAAESGKTILLDCGKGVQLNTETATTFFFSLIPRVFAEGFTIEIECTDGHIETKSSSKSFALSRNTIYKLKEFTINPAGEPEEPVEPVEPVDPEPEIPEPEPVEVEELTDANCFIIPLNSKKAYEIPTSRVNTFWGSTTDGNNPSNLLTQNFTWKPELIWYETENADDDDPEIIFCDAEGKEQESFVGNVPFYVRVNSPKGLNVLIGITKEGSSNYLWSWHLWVTDYQPGTSPETTTGGIIHQFNGSFAFDEGGLYYGKYFMDRNLGATKTGFDGVSTVNPDTNPSIAGLYYQFNRKDPFYMTVSSDNPSSVSNGSVTVDKSVENPKIFYTAGSDGENWCSSSNTSIWSDSPKSLYDPCPAGWRVPKIGDLLVQHPWGYIAQWLNATEEGGRQNNHSTHGKAWYPYSGYLSATDATLQDFCSAGHYWGVTFDGASKKLLFDSSSLNPSASAVRASAMTIRCVQE